MTWTELLQWLTEYFFDSAKHFIELLLVIMASFLTFHIKIDRHEHYEKDNREEEA